MSSSIRPIVIDDTDSRIEYTGQGWFKNSEDGPGNFGAPYLHTRHGTNSNDSFSFSFTGTSLRKVAGTTALTQIPIINGTGNGTTWDPKWECFIDGVSIGSTQPFSGQVNNWPLCEGNSQLADGNHTLTLNVTTMGNTFWFDQLQFIPSSHSAYGNGTNVVFVDIGDPAIEYGDGWGPWGTGANHTSTQGSQLKLNFTGTSLSWYGVVPPENPIDGPFATYTIDGGSPVPFSITTNPVGGIFFQLFFTTSNLSPAEHSLVVTYLGSTNTTAPGLMLTYMYLTNATIPSSSVSVGSSPTSTASSSSSGPTLSFPSAHLGPILGAVFGGIFLATLILLFLYKRKKRPKQKQASVITGDISPFLSSVPTEPTIQQSSLPAPFSKPRSRALNNTLPYSDSSDQLNGRSLNFGRLHAKSATSSSSGIGSSGPNNSMQESREMIGSRSARNGDGPNVVVQHHQDSGLRIGSGAMRVDIPPVYTAS